MDTALLLISLLRALSGHPIGAGYKMYIENMIEDHMKTCKGFNLDYCDPSYCEECCDLNKNLKYEYWKHSGLCFRCQGPGILSVWRCIVGRGVVSTTKKCFLCAGTGKFNNKNAGPCE